MMEFSAFFCIFIFLISFEFLNSNSFICFEYESNSLLTDFISLLTLFSSDNNLLCSLYAFSNLLSISSN